MVNRLLLEADDADRAAGGTGVLDRGYIETYTTGFEEFAARARAVSWEQALAATGLRREAIEGLAEHALDARSVIICCAMGLTQHRHGVPTIREVVNFLMLRGNIGRHCAGVCPVRGTPTCRATA